MPSPIQPKKAELPHLPILIEAKFSWPDFHQTSTNAARIIHQDHLPQCEPYGKRDVVFVPFFSLVRYFDARYLGLEAGPSVITGLSIVLEDLDQLGNLKIMATASTTNHRRTPQADRTDPSIT